MPNRIYFTNLRGQDEAMLVGNLANVVLYALLELASVLALSAVLGRRLGVAAIHQLAFVLQLQWRFVQCKLAMWLVLAVQAPLEHVGNDFSHGYTQNNYGILFRKNNMNSSNRKTIAKQSVPSEP